MKKLKFVLVLSFVAVLLFFNYLTLFADVTVVDYKWKYDLPAVGKLEACQQKLGYGWIRGSVEWVCIVQWVCPECKCTAEACGQVSITH